jgi:DNA polymerase-3 subunit beta
MQITISQQSLSRELSLLAGAADKKSSIPILSTVLIEASDGRVRLTTTDMELSLHTEVDATVTKSGAAAIPIDRLLPFVRSLHSGEVTISIASSGHATINCGKTRARIPGESSAGYPELPTCPADPVITIPASKLARAARSVMYAISDEESRFTLNGALLDLNGHVRMVSTDGHRLALYETDGNAAMPIKCMVPRKMMAQIIKLAATLPVGTPAEIYIDEGRIWVKASQYLLMARRLTGNFPDYDRVVPKSFPARCEVSASDLKASLDRVNPFADARSKAIKLTIAGGQVSVRANNSDTGECEDLVDTVAEINLESGFNASYLSDFLGICGTDKVAVSYKDGQSAIRLDPIGGSGEETVFGIVMPMRV